MVVKWEEFDRTGNELSLLGAVIRMSAELLLSIYHHSEALRSCSNRLNETANGDSGVGYSHGTCCLDCGHDCDRNVLIVFWESGRWRGREYISLVVEKVEKGRVVVALV